MTNYMLSFIVAFVVVIVTTPIVKKLAFKVGAVDVPKDERRIHKQPIARLGGLAIFYGFLISFGFFSVFNRETLGLLLGSIIIVTVGVFDDIKPLKAKVKLLFQIIAAMVVVFCGVEIQFISNPFVQSKISSLNFYGISTIITVLWIVGVTNAVNLIDGLDGLAAGVSSIASIFLLFIALINGNTNEVILTAAIAGATLGFLPFNFNPAKIFMGDTGATFLGFALAVISIQGKMKGYTSIALLVPLIVLGLPIFDTAFAIIRRIIKGKPVMQADRGHLHHRLIDAGFSQKKSVLLLYTISAFLGVSALVLAQSGFVKGIIVFSIVILFSLLGFKLINYNTQQKQRVK